MGQLSSGAFDGSGTGVFRGGSAIRTITAIYDFAKHGGAQGNITIGSIPSGSTIIGGYMNVNTALTSGGAATGLISSEGAGDIIASALVSGAPWSTTGKKAIVPKRNTPETTSITTTAARNILFVVGTADLTAGKFTLVLEVLGAV